MAPVLGAVIALFVAGSIVVGCDGTTEEVAPPPEGIYVVPTSLDELADDTFFDHPFPSDLRMENGHVRMKGWPNPRAVPLLDEYIGFIDGKLEGFSPVAAGFLRFTGAIDPETLPDAAGSLEETASVQLVDIDPDSPSHGSRTPIYVTFRRDAGVYWQPNTLSFMPVPGYTLRPKTRYALVVTDGIKAESGDRVVASPTLREVLGLESPESDAIATALDTLAPSVAELKTIGLDPERIVQLAVFTTDDPTAEFMAAAAALPDQVDPPTADEDAWQAGQHTSEYDEYLGSYGPSPNYQVGETPFTHFGDGGGFELDDSGVPQVVDSFDLRFSLTVPNATKCPMPKDGYPIVLYAHGTGGDYQSYRFDGTAASLAKQCLASMGVDQIFHGTRPGAPDSETGIELLFFNFQNIESARTNIRQSGLDEVQRARLFTESQMTIPQAVAADGAEVKFDPSKVMFFGHSQGSLNGPLFLAGSDAARGGVLSGASSVIQITLLEKTQPEPSIAALVKTIFLQLSEAEEAEVGLLYPPIALAQTIIDPVDPGNYARFIIPDPAFGGPKSVYMTEGIAADGTGDSFAPPRGCEALATTMGLPFQEPLQRDPVDAIGGTFPSVSVPAEGLSGNLAGGEATGIIAQFAPTTDDGHFVVFDIPEATNQAAGFLRNLADDPKGRVPALGR